MNEYTIGIKESITCGGLKKLSKPKLSCQSKSKYPDNNWQAGITANKKFFGQIIVIITAIKKTRDRLEYITRCAGWKKLSTSLRAWYVISQYAPVIPEKREIMSVTKR